MLVLTRRCGEKIRIGKDIIIEVARLSGDRARIGITAPPEVSIRRAELTDTLAADAHPRGASGASALHSLRQETPMSIQCEIIRKVESETGDELTVGFPDKSGQIVTLTNVGDADLDALKTGGLYTIGFVPFVAPTSPSACEANAASCLTLVPTDHPLVIDSDSAASYDCAMPSDVVVPAEAATDATDETPPEEQAV